MEEHSLATLSARTGPGLVLLELYVPALPDLAGPDPNWL